MWEYFKSWALEDEQTLVGDIVKKDIGAEEHRFAAKFSPLGCFIFSARLNWEVVRERLAKADEIQIVGSFECQAKDLNSTPPQRANGVFWWNSKDLSLRILPFLSSHPGPLSCCYLLHLQNKMLHSLFLFLLQKYMS